MTIDQVLDIRIKQLFEGKITPTYQERPVTTYHDLTIKCDNAHYAPDWDFARGVGLCPTAFSRVVNTYCHAPDIENFQTCCLELLKKGRHGIVSMQFARKEANIRSKQGKYGNCLLSLSMRVQKQQLPEFILVSRSTYMGWTSHIDSAITALIIQPMLPGTFTWHIQSAAVHWFRCAPFLWQAPWAQRFWHDRDNHNPWPIELGQLALSITKEEIKTIILWENDPDLVTQPLITNPLTILRYRRAWAYYRRGDDSYYNIRKPLLFKNLNLC